MNSHVNPQFSSRRRVQPSPAPRTTVTLSQTTLLLAHFANLKLSADRLVHSTLSVTLHRPAIPFSMPTRTRNPRRRRRRNLTVNKLSDADLEAELAARRAARTKERERYARAIRSEKLSALEGELSRLRQELVRVGRGSGGLHGTPPTARWEALPERRSSKAVPPGTPVPRGPGAPPPMPPPPAGEGDPLFVDPETRRIEKEERQRRREAKRKEREANRKPLTLAEIIKAAGPHPMKRLKPPGSIAVPDVHEPQDDGNDDDELNDVREGLKKVASGIESEEGKGEKKEGDDTKEGNEKGDEGENGDKGESEDGEEKGEEGEKAATGEEKTEEKDGEENLSEHNQHVGKGASKQEEELKMEAKNENLNPLNAKPAETDSQPQTGVQSSTQTKATPKSPKRVPAAGENKQDDEQPASDGMPESEKSPTKINTSTNEDATKTPPKPTSQPSESATKELKLPNGVDALAALSNLKLKLPAKSSSVDMESNAADVSAGNGESSTAGSASDGPTPRPMAPPRLSIEQKRRIRRAKKEEGVKME